MWAEQAAPRIGSRLSGRSYSSVTLKTIGLGESALEDAIVDLVAKTNPIVATYAKDDGVHVRVVGIADDEESARAIRDEAAAEVSRRLQRWLYGEDEVTLAGSIAAQLRHQGLKIRIVDHGGGAQFAALMLGDQDGAGVTIDAIARAADDTSAAELAKLAQRGEADVLGIGISLTASPAGAVFDGMIGIAVSGKLSGGQDFPMKSSLHELQRRSMLFTADVLHRLLDGTLD